MKGDSAGNMLHNCRCYCASAYGGGSGCLGLGAVGNRPSIIHSARPSGWERCRGGGCGWLRIRSCVGVWVGLCLIWGYCSISAGRVPG